MKVKSQNEPLVFKPVVVELVFESQEELEAMKAFTGCLSRGDVIEFGESLRDSSVTDRVSSIFHEMTAALYHHLDGLGVKGK